MGRFDGKIVVVTGAASGMGREVAKCFAAEGAKVVALDISCPTPFRSEEHTSELQSQD